MMMVSVGILFDMIALGSLIGVFIGFVLFLSGLGWAMSRINGQGLMVRWLQDCVSMYVPVVICNRGWGML